MKKTITSTQDAGEYVGGARPKKTVQITISEQLRDDLKGHKGDHTWEDFLSTLLESSAPGSTFALEENLRLADDKIATLERLNVTLSRENEALIVLDKTRGDVSREDYLGALIEADQGARSLETNFKQQVAEGISGVARRPVVLGDTAVEAFVLALHDSELIDEIHRMGSPAFTARKARELMGLPEPVKPDEAPDAPEIAPVDDVVPFEPLGMTDTLEAIADALDPEVEGGEVYVGDPHGS